jgi:hypothetical protein
MKVMSLTSCAGRLLPPGRFFVLISLTGSFDPRVTVRPERLGQFEKSNDLIGNRTRELPAWSIVFFFQRCYECNDVKFSNLETQIWTVFPPGLQGSAEKWNGVCSVEFGVWETSCGLEQRNGKQTAEYIQAAPASVTLFIGAVTSRNQWQLHGGEKVPLYMLSVVLRVMN